MSKTYKQGYFYVISFIKTDMGTLLRDVSSRHQPGKKKSEVGWLLLSLGAKTSGEQTLLMMAVFQLKNL